MRKKNEGIALLEFAIIAPILFLVVLGMIDLFRYLYLANVLEARAHRALEVASWIPGLNEAEHPLESTEPNSNFMNALTAVKSAVIDSEISTLFTTDGSGKGSAKLLGENSIDRAFFKEMRQGIEQDKADFNEIEEDVVIALPPLQPGTNSRDVAMASQPIGVRVNAELKPLTPFMPPLRVSGEAWGFRETNAFGSRAPMLDCLGKPLNPKKLPTPEDCNCGDLGINPNNGQCGCPPGTKWGDIPGPPVEFACICDVTFNADGSATIKNANGSILTCGEAQAIDYNVCKCKPNCAMYNGIHGQTRDKNNECGCDLSGKYYTKSLGCGQRLNSSGVLVDDPTETKGCTHQNCVPQGESLANYPGWKYNPYYCGCSYCSWWGIVLEDKKTSSTDHIPTPVDFNPHAKEQCSCKFRDTGTEQKRTTMNTSCQCADAAGNPLPPKQGDLILDIGTCQYGCSISDGITPWIPGTQIPITLERKPGLNANDPNDDVCACPAGYTTIQTPSYLAGCCPTSLCDPTTSDPWYRDGVAEDQGQQAGACSGGRCCYCACKSGFLPATEYTCCDYTIAGNRCINYVRPCDTKNGEKESSKSICVNPAKCPGSSSEKCIVGL